METADRVWQVALQFEMDVQAGKMPGHISLGSPQFQKLRNVSVEQADTLWWLGIPIYLNGWYDNAVALIYHPPLPSGGHTFWTLVEVEDSEGEA